MLAVLTAALLAVAMVLAAVFPKNTLTILVGGVGTLVLFPLTVIIALLYISLSVLGGVPVLGSLEPTLDGLLTGAYGFGWGPYVALSVPLWLGVVLRIGDTTEQEDDSPQTAERTTDETAEEHDLMGLGGVDGAVAEALREAGYETGEHVAAADQEDLQAVEGVSTALAARMKAETAHVEVSDEVDATVAKLRAGTEERDETDPVGTWEADGDEASEANEDKKITELTDISGVNEAKAEALHEADYGTINYIRGASQDELANVGGIGMALAARIKADVGDIELEGVEEEVVSFENNEKRTNLYSVDESSDAESTERGGERSGFVDGEDESRAKDGTDRVGGRDAGPDRAEQSPEASATSDEDALNKLTSLPEVGQTKREALVRAGYTTVDELQTASFSELTTVVGGQAAVEIRDQLGYIKESPEGDSSTSTGDAHSKGGRESELTPEQQTESGQSESERDAFKSDSGHDERRIESLRDEVESHWEQATTEPLADPEATREELIRGHTRAVELAERAAEHDRSELIRFAQETLDKTERRLDALPEIADALDAARGRVPPERGPSAAVRTQSLDRAREYYDTAIETAEQVGFSTAQLERECEQIRAELAGRETATIARPSESESESDPESEGESGPDSEPNVEPDAAPAAGAETEPDTASESVDESVHTSGLQLDQATASESSSDPESDTGDEPGGESPSPSSEDPITATTTDTEPAEENTTRPDTKPPTEPTKADYVEAIQQVADASDRVVKSTDVSERTPYSATRIINAFGSWQTALEAAGVDNETRLVDALCRVADEVGGRPTRSDVDEHAHINAEMYDNYFESYANAVERASVDKQDTEDTEMERTPDREDSDTEDTTGPSRQALCDELQRLDAVTDGYPKTTELHAHGAYNPGAYGVFGSWEDALEAAGIDKRQRLVEDIRRVAERTDGEPSTLDMDEHGAHSSKTHSKYFGGWDAALDAAGLSEKTGASDRQSSGDSASRAATDSVTESTSDRVSSADGDSSPDAFARISEITEDGRLDQPIALKLRDTLETSGSRKQACLLVDDLDGNQCQMNLWQTHSDDVTWEVEIGHWYVLSEARGKVWANSDETKRRLSSTKALRVEHVGTDPPMEHPESAYRSESDKTTSSDASETADAGAPADETETNGILDEVTSEFDDLPGTGES